ncbi:J domain-containing protein [Specibacter cremeus]|uniref:J domain-containing protein n=1 Tax=Specibacter cremeus TaxID=1629051 RepID=UPI000F792F3E|nr:J domain-containing protein [Specibacter cremeus]
MGEQFRTHYQVLGVPATATAGDIKKAYRRAARAAHPDHGGDPAEFRAVTEAYEALINPARRQAYDRSYGAGSRQAPRGTSDTAAGFSTSARAGTGRNVAAEAAVYFPAYEDLPAGTEPLLPRSTAAQPVHGAPRKRGVFGAHARMAREAYTIRLIMTQLLPAIPSARLVNGLQSPVGKGQLDHVIVAGYRMVVVASMLLPEGAYRWNGSSLMHGAKAVEPPRLDGPVRAMQELFPECNVTGWVCVHSTTGSQFEPVIDYARGTDPDGTGGLNVANAARFIREAKFFLASGPVPNVVDLQVLSRLLGGMY